MTRQHIVFLTGAGVSAESGLSTFRGKDGMWTNEEWVHLASTDALYNEKAGRGGAERCSPHDSRAGERA